MKLLQNRIVSRTYKHTKRDEPVGLNEIELLLQLRRDEKASVYLTFIYCRKMGVNIFLISSSSFSSVIFTICYWT